MSEDGRRPERAQPEVIVIGAACVDTKGQPDAALIQGTSNPGEIRITVGGVGRNIAEALGRLGVPVSLITAVGDDVWGRDLVRRTRKGGVDLRELLVCRGERSAAYMAILDEKGDRIVSIDSTDIMAHIDGRYIFDRRRLFAQAKIVVLDGNVSPSALSTVLRLAEQYHLRVAVDPTSVVLAAQLRPYLRSFYLVTPDANEAEALTGIRVADESDAVRAAQALVAAGVKVAIVTLAEHGCCYATSEVVGHVPAVRIDVVDRTGAGDSLTAAVVFGLLNDFPVDEAVQLGVAAAALTIGSKESVYPELSLEALYDALVPRGG
jgi:pseudouridine kinase